MVVRVYETVYQDFIDKIVDIFEAEKTYLGVKFVGGIDHDTISSYPSIIVNLSTADEEYVSMPSIKCLTMTADIIYWHMDANKEVRGQEIREAAGRINALLREKYDLEGFCDYASGDKIGSLIVRTEFFGKLRGLVGDALIKFEGYRKLRL